MALVLVPVVERTLLVLVFAVICSFYACPGVEARSEDCHLRPVIHVLQQPGCIPKPIPSFACQGSCSSYVQVSGSKFWQVERSCMCCQEVGEREASIGIFCPKAAPRFRRIVTRAPVECMCRPCTAVDEATVRPQETASMVEADHEMLMGDMPGSDDFHVVQFGKEIPVV